MNRCVGQVTDIALSLYMRTREGCDFGPHVLYTMKIEHTTIRAVHWRKIENLQRVRILRRIAE